MLEKWGIGKVLAIHEIFGISGRCLWENCIPVPLTTLAPYLLPTFNAIPKQTLSPTQYFWDPYNPTHWSASQHIFII